MMRHRTLFDDSMFVISFTVALGVAATIMPAHAATTDNTTRAVALMQSTDQPAGTPDAAPAAPAQPQTPADLGLTRTTDTRSRIVYTKPGTDFSRFRTVQLMTLEVPPDSRDAAPSGARTRMRESFVLQDRDVQDLQAAFAQSMRTVMGNAGFTFVDTPQADTLIVGPMVSDITLSAPVSNTRTSGRSRTYTRGGGSISIAAVLADGTTGEILGQVAAASRPTNIWRINNRVTNMSDARTAFNQWARSLVDTLRNNNSYGGR
jgi:Protein of unknown function (DUF3313)